MAFVAAALPAITAITAVAGAGISAAGVIEQGNAQRSAANYQAQVANNNSIIAEQNAVHAEQAASADAENAGRKGAAQLAALKVAQAANGVDVNSGSNLDVQVGERETNQLNTENVFQNDILKAYGYRVNKENFQAEGALDTAKASEAVPAAALKATGGLLSSASSIGGKWGSGGSWGGSSSSGTSDPTQIGSLY